MIREIKYLIFFLIIILFTFFSIKYYKSDENQKKTYTKLNLVEKNIILYENKLPIIKKDTENIIIYLNNDKSSDKKKYSFWELIKREN
mgnify:FL=1|tara:strand:+ start:2882 stop:3145 length:264 start_codon:yes stop_codon:yes gene_type:complete